MTQGLVALVKSKTAITDLIGSGNNCRFYAREIPQGTATYPAAAFRTVDIQDTSDSDGGSDYDFGFVDIHCYGESYGSAHNLFETMRDNLEDQSGTYGGVVIHHVWYVPSGMDDYLNELELYTKQLELKIAYGR